MSSSDSNTSGSSNYSSGRCSWHFVGSQSESEKYETSSEDSSDDLSPEKVPVDLWTGRRNIFISVYNGNNYKGTTLITNYSELHNYWNKYSKLSKKTTSNIKTIWNEVKINVPNLGIVPLKLYENELTENSKDELKKKTTTVDKLNKTIVDNIKSPLVNLNLSCKATPNAATLNQITTKLNTNETITSNEIDSNIKIQNKENVSKKVSENLTKVAKSNEENKRSPIKGSAKVDEKDKDIKSNIVVVNVAKFDVDKKNFKTQSTNSTDKLNESDKSSKNKFKEIEFKKPQIKSESNKIKNGKNNSKEIISQTKLKNQKQTNSNSQCSGNSDIDNHSCLVDSPKLLKEKAIKKVEVPDTEAIDNDENGEEIIDNMDILTGNSKATNDEMFEFIKYKDKKKAVETLKVADKKINQRSNDESIKITPAKNDVSLSDSEKDYLCYSEKFAENSIDMMMSNNLMGALDCLVEALQFNPGDDRHYLNRCYCYLRMNRPTSALGDAQYLLQTSSHYGHRFIAYLRAGQASMALQKYTQAENYFRDALSINSNNLYAQRELVRAKISKIVSLGYTERNAVLALLKHSKTQEAINYLANKNIANNENKSDYYAENYGDIADFDDLVYSSDEDERPNCTTLINNMINYEPTVTKLFHLLAKPVNLTTNTLLLNKNTIGNSKKKNNTNNKVNTGQVMNKSIWVGSLNKSITEIELKKYFKQFGNIVSIYCPSNEAYAFVNFEKSEHVINVLKTQLSHEINGVKLVVRQGIQKKMIHR